MLLNKTLRNTLIFTDLDGTLLDHDTYSFEPALPMLDFIKTHHIPLIIVTSKTKSEVIELQKALDISSPFIIENGAGIIVPTDKGHTMIPLGKLYAQTRESFVRYAEKIKMRGFFDMSVEEIMSYTGLSYDNADHARQRTFSEPFILEEEKALTRLKTMADKDGFDIVKGGRFYHLITKGQDKANAVKKVIEMYKEKEHGNPYVSIALGDSDNDLTMLANVDVPILIPHKDGSYIDNNITNLAKASFPGPRGWNSALQRYFHV